MDSCLFCKIISGEIPSKKLYEDEFVYVFDDIEPQAPVHFLVIPKKHLKSLDALEEEDELLGGHILRVASKIAKEKGIEGAYRIVSNCGEEAGQSVGHLHFHVLGGRSLNWPPG